MPAYVKENCNGCAICIDECPLGAIELDAKAIVDDEICTECGACIDVCPVDAITMV